jgi:hypothetical protein
MKTYTKKSYFYLLATLIFFIAGFFLWTSLRNRNSQQEQSASSLSKSETIEQALSLKLQAPEISSCVEEKQTLEEITSKVRQADYVTALLLAIQGLEKFPESFSLQSDLAALVGNLSHITDEPLKSKMIEWSKILFDQLLKVADGQPKEVYFPFKNEYFFRFGMYLEQYNLGIERAAHFWGTDEWASFGFKGYYSQGVGATYHAKKLLIEGNEPLAREYAQKAVVAWAQYFSYKNDYYNSYVHYALALGILGYKEEMMRALERSASLIKRDLNYQEFKDVTDFFAEKNIVKIKSSRPIKK